MKQEVIQDFLTVSGIVGVVLMDGRSRPYFYGRHQNLNFQQREALAQGIQQVIHTTPADFQRFEFQFANQQIHLHKLDQNLILLVLAQSTLMPPVYLKAVETLKGELLADPVNAIATFRLLANSTPPEEHIWSPARQSFSPNSFSSPGPQPESSASTIVTSEDAASLQELLVALNHLSRFTTQYLGTIVVTNYWKTSQPPIEWLNHFQIERSAQFSCSSSFSSSTCLTVEQLTAIQTWVMAFMDQCSRVIRDFPRLVQQRALNERQKTLLLPDLV